MSRLTDIMENHERLDSLMSIIKHHGVNAAFLTEALLLALEQPSEEETEEEQAETTDTQALVEDLQQFKAHF